MSARVLAKNALWSSAGHLMSRGSLILAAILLARHLDTPSFAAYSYFQLTISLLAAYAAMGLGVAASRFFAYERTLAEEATPLAGTVWLLSISLALIAFLVASTIPDAWIAAGLGVPRWLLATGVLVLALQIVPDGAILGLERYSHAALIAAFAGGITLGGAAVAIAMHDARWAMGALLAASLFQTAAGTAVVFHAMGSRRLRASLPVTAAHVRAVLGFSGPMFLVTLLSASAGWVVGRIILSGPGGAHEFALFTIGLQWFALAMFIPGMLARVMLPRLVVGARDTSGVSAARNITKTGVLMTIAAALAVAMAGIALGPTIFRLYGERYRGDHSLITFFLAAAVMCAPANALGNAILAHDGQWQWFGLTTVWYFALVGFAWAFKEHGAWGGSVSYAAAYTVFAGGALLLARNRSLL